MLSMTGFGKTEIEREGRRVRVEIKTVNNRFLDVNIRLPRSIMYLEDSVRKQLAEKINRGHVDVFINYYCDRDDAKKVLLNTGIVNSYYKAAEEASNLLGIENDISVVDILRLPDVVSFEDNDDDGQAIESVLRDAVAGALDELIRARMTEGDKLASDIIKRIDLVAELCENIAEKEDTVVSDFKLKLEERLSQILEPDNMVDDVRLAQEVAFFADKCNITEEIVRIKSHASQFKDAVNSDGPQGRNLDFIVQELNREFNTIGSKSNEVSILNNVIKAKGEIEKIREQIQNIE